MRGTPNDFENALFAKNKLVAGLLERRAFKSAQNGEKMLKTVREQINGAIGLPVSMHRLCKENNRAELETELDTIRKAAQTCDKCAIYFTVSLGLSAVCQNSLTGGFTGLDYMKISDARVSKAPW